MIQFNTIREINTFERQYGIKLNCKQVAYMDEDIIELHGIDKGIKYACYV